VLTAKRWELVKVLCGAGPVSIREAARRVDRDVKAVHSDVTALLNAGLLVELNHLAEADSVDIRRGLFAIHQRRKRPCNTC